MSVRKTFHGGLPENLAITFTQLRSPPLAHQVTLRKSVRARLDCAGTVAQHCSRVPGPPGPLYASLQEFPNSPSRLHAMLHRPSWFTESPSCNAVKALCLTEVPSCNVA